MEHFYDGDMEKGQARRSPESERQTKDNVLR